MAFLKLATAKRSIDKVEPYTQLAIVTTAVERWLRPERYLGRR